MQIITSLPNQTITVLLSNGKARTFTVEEAEHLRDMLKETGHDALVEKLDEEISRLKRGK